jgi:tRNA A-37 threonylcarbamoyl transferase component Bud32
VSPDRPSPSRATAALPRHVQAALAVCALTLVYLALQVSLVRPYLWPAGHGALVAGDSRFTGGAGDRTMLLARPPEMTDHPIGATVVREIAPDSPAARAGLRTGDEIVHERLAGTAVEVDLRPLITADPAGQLRIWRDAYWLGLRGPLDVRVVDTAGEERSLELRRMPAWRSDPSILAGWARRHVGMMLQIVVFTGAALVLLYLRSRDATATFAVMALALCAAGGGGPLMGSERVLPHGPREVMTVFAWIASPLAFPVTGLAILYFPSRSPLLTRHPWLHALPFVAAAPMLAAAAGTALFLVGVDALEGAAVWDAQHPRVFLASFAAALAVNVAAVAEGLHRFRSIRDQNDKRRIRVVVLTAVPGVFAYALKDGVPVVAQILTGQSMERQWLVTLVLQLLVLLPAPGLAYAVAVHRVLAPRVMLRQSVQYALAKNTLRAIALLPAIALLWSIYRHRDMTIGMVFSGAPGFYIGLFAAAIAGYRYRERAGAWLDQRFFRAEYDARKILQSLVSRVRFETDPSDLTSLVLNQIDEALHPETSAILISGVEERLFTPVAIHHGSAESLPLEGGLASMLRWSDDPLELDLADARSPARRLPAAEQEWLECTGSTLLVPIAGEDRALVGLIALGQKRSEEPYTAEDRQLLAGIAAQVGLGLDVARLRRRLVESTEATTMATGARVGLSGLMECPRCGRCADPGAAICASDGAMLVEVAAMPRVIDNKYRVDQLLGRGGMGAVYRARDVRLDRDVALKVVRADLLERSEARRRFRREAQLVARLQHPSIVSVFDYGTVPDGGAFLVMELVKGEDLRTVLKREGRLPIDRTVRLMRAICGAIETAHREGILHRDLKPENILLPGGDAEVKVLDFGVAKLLDADEPGDAALTVTMAGTIVGTPAYMAPEQLRGKGLGVHTDVFSLGVLAYEMMTGALPFGAGSIADIALRQAMGPPQFPSDPDVPPDMRSAILDALQPEPAARPQSATAFAERLAALPQA